MASHLRGGPSHCRHQRFVYQLLKCSGNGSTLPKKKKKNFVKQSCPKEMVHFLSHTSALHKHYTSYKHEVGVGILLVKQHSEAYLPN